jgi:anti-sigma-K factor RskA
MDIKAYLESGVLEQYAMGLLSEAEAAEVLRMATQYQEVREELRIIEQTLEQYAQATGVALPEGLKARIMSRVEAEAQPPQPNTKSPRNAGIKTTYLILLLGLLVVLGILWWSTSLEAEALQTELDQVQAEKQDLQLDCQQQGERLLLLEEQLGVLRSDAYRSVELQTVKPEVPAVASVFYNVDGQKAYLDFKALPALPAGKTYQLWALVDGQPVDMGVVDLQQAEDGFLEVSFVAGAGAFAITVEPAGGLPTPTLTEMVVLGTLG